MPHRHWAFSIPRLLRGLVERDRKLLGLLPQTAYAAILKTFQALFDRTDVRPGCVVSLQTHGAYGANFKPQTQDTRQAANCRAFCPSKTDFGPAIGCLPRVLPDFPPFPPRFPLCSRIEMLISKSQERSD